MTALHEEVRRRAALLKAPAADRPALEVVHEAHRCGLTPSIAAAAGEPQAVVLREEHRQAPPARRAAVLFPPALRAASSLP